MEQLFVTNSIVQLSLIEEMLRQNNIIYYVQNHYTQNLFGIGTVGGTNMVIGDMAIYVDESNIVLGKSIIEDIIKQQQSESPTTDS